MKKSVIRILSAVVAAAAIVMASVTSAFAAPSETMNITLRIEGVKGNLYYDTAEVPYTDKLTVQDAVKYIDDSDDSLTVTGVETAWITSVNGDTSGQFGGWDGWLYRVNGVEPSVGIGDYTMNDGDSILLYYGDPYGVGMQYPVADVSKLDSGVIKFTSSDTEYDDSYNPIVKVNPVSGMTVVWNYPDGSAKYVTDENGEINIDKAQLTAGNHALSLEKYASNGLPLVLRLAPDYTVNVTESSGSASSGDVSSSVDDTSSAVSSAVGDTAAVSPKTGDAGAVYAALAMMIIVAAGAYAVCTKTSDER
jgi:hypothetical protein